MFPVKKTAWHSFFFVLVPSIMCFCLCRKECCIMKQVQTGLSQGWDTLYIGKQKKSTVSQLILLLLFLRHPWSLNKNYTPVCTCQKLLSFSQLSFPSIFFYNFLVLFLRGPCNHQLKWEQSEVVNVKRRCELSLLLFSSFFYLRRSRQVSWLAMNSCSSCWDKVCHIFLYILASQTFRTISTL